MRRIKMVVRPLSILLIAIFALSLALTTQLTEIPCTEDLLFQLIRDRPDPAAFQNILQVMRQKVGEAELPHLAFLNEFSELIVTCFDTSHKRDLVLDERVFHDLNILIILVLHILLSFYALKRGKSNLLNILV